MKFVNTKPVKALQDGMVYALPFIIIGSVFLIYLIFQFQLWLLLLRPLVGQRSLTRLYSNVWGSLLWAAVGIAYVYVRSEGMNHCPLG